MGALSVSGYGASPGNDWRGLGEPIINGRQGTQMKKILLATTAALMLAAGSAGAADLARPVYKAAPPPPPACAQFGGFYVGASVGYGS
jgi:hypothetical protein